MTTADLMDLVCRDYEVNGHRTLETVRQRGKHLVRLLPHLPTTQDVEQYKVARLREGAARATVNNELAALRRGLRLAVEYGLLHRAPKVRMLRVYNVRTATCTLGQFRVLVRALDTLDPPVGHLARWLVWTGWRVGESKGLTWSHFSVDRKTVCLPGNESKNQRPRHVALGGAVRFLVETRWDLRDGEHVFHRGGKPIKTFRGPWARAAEGAGVPDLHVHDLRRFFAQQATDLGIPIPVQMEIAGWKSMTMHRRYCIVDGSMQRAALDRVTDWLSVGG